MLTKIGLSMNALSFVSDLVELNGLTLKENNFNSSHKFQIGDIVEVMSDTASKGLRLFVVELARDCDGAPMYSLSFNKNANLELQTAKVGYIKNNKSGVTTFSALDRAVVSYIEGSIAKGYGEDALQLVPKS